MSNQKFKFKSPEGTALCRRLLQERLPFTPHDYQLKGIASILDGRDYLGISATGSGKTAYIYMTLHVIQAILNNPAICPDVTFPEDASILVVSPTTALEENQEHKIKEYGLTAKAVNSVTKQEADHRGENIWKDVEAGTAVILVSPEMLSSKGFEIILHSKIFQARLFAIAIDEVHLLNSWGTDFRPAFQQIAYMRARFQRRVILFAMTATLRKGKPMDSILGFLGFHSGGYDLHRRSNARPDIQLIFRTLNATQGSDRFPQLDWVLRETGKVLIFCPTIRFGFKLAVYFWYLDPRRAVLNQIIRLFNSLNSPEYNRQTLQLLEGTNKSTITIATDKLSVGVDVPDFQMVVIIEPKTLDDLWQKAGRVGRDRSKVSGARVIVYFPKEFMKTVLSTQDGNSSTQVDTGEKRKRKRSKKAAGSDETTPKIDDGLREIILAKCLMADIDCQYDNPAQDEPCSQECVTCLHLAPPPPTIPSAPCICSKCVPERSPPPPEGKSHKKPFPERIRVTKEMRKIAISTLHEFREALWADADEIATGMVPVESFLPDVMTNSIIDNFPTLLSKDILEPFVHGARSDLITASQTLLEPFILDNQFVRARAHDLLHILWDLHMHFDDIRQLKKDQAKAKKAAQNNEQEAGSDIVEDSDE
ncbi:hypothetical protein NLJ89_g6696 [Agrocybe chaxingu]|uniref:DNA 3'-5' helicase n=1 Tax=Agrocybe chaxingu TaxID=84603 RepID=A0A9W8K5Y4_9AGAR|nr:hypothetical protein NLJ89_g6696 [Agrocybe chaxingu]